MKKRVLVYLLGSALLVSLASLAGGSAAAADTRTATTHMDTEAWYQQLGPCTSLIDCSDLPAPNPYPEDTLHVAATGGQENARTYLAFSLAAVPSDGELLGGTLTLPIDAASEDGSFSPDQADILACLVTEPFKPVRASAAEPPPTDCKTSAPASYEKKQAAFTVDLAPFALAWQGGRAALALLPAKSTQQDNGTWHVTFFATRKDSKDTPPITATIDYTVQSASGGGGSTPTTSTGSTGVIAAGPAIGSGSSAVPTFTGGGGFGSFPTTTTTTTTTTIGQTPAQPETQLAPTSLEGFAGPGFAYPLVWALPLVFLAAFGAIGRVLTKDLYRRGI